MKSLDKLIPGEKGLIVEFETANLPLKLIEMGCLPGNEVELLYLAPFDDPMYLKVDGTHIAIRKDLASQILIDLII
jgi:ferrous iron transport protein A